MNLKLEKNEHSSRITLDGEVLKSFNGYFDVEDEDHSLIEKLYHSFQGVKEDEVQDGSVIGETYEENKIFELYKRLTENQEEIIKENLHHFIQWTPVFRASPDPHIKMDQYAYYGSLFSWLGAYKLEMEDLPSNMCQSGEEFDEMVKEYEESGCTFKVSDPLISTFLKEALALEPKKQAGLLFLYFSFDEPVFPLLYMTGACDPEEMAKATLAASAEIPGMGIDQEEFDRVSSMRTVLAERVLKFIE